MPHFECGAFDHSATYPHAQVIQAVLQYTGAGAEIKAHGKAHGKKSDAAAMWKAMVCKAGQEFAKRTKGLQNGPRGGCMFCGQSLPRRLTGEACPKGFWLQNVWLCVSLRVWAENSFAQSLTLQVSTANGFQSGVGKPTPDFI